MNIPTLFLSSSASLCRMLAAAWLSSGVLAAADKPNVLFIAVDDLKPLLGCYGESSIRTPNIDRLAATGTVFLHAYCQQAVCGPSRASLLTGLRPDTTRVWDLQTRLRDQLPDVVTLPQHFKRHGYVAVGMGKVFDPRSVDGPGKDDPQSWSRPYTQLPVNPRSEFGYLGEEFVARARAAQRKEIKVLGGGPVCELDHDVPDEAYGDGILAAKAVKAIGELAPDEKPYFLAVGFAKPHLPFVAPKKYADLYPLSAIRLAPFQKRPAGAPEYALQDSGELKNGSFAGFANLQGALPAERQKELIQGYMACVSYMDAQFGKVLDAVEKSGEAEKTIVVLWGDHGWHLGDHGMWCKHTNYEQATRAPLIIARRAKGGMAAKAPAPVEFVDIFPTLCELAAIPSPEHLHGKSLVPVLDDPKAITKEFAVSQYPRGARMGYAFRDGRYRYVRWVRRNEPNVLQAEELYDYKEDPFETRNLLDEPAAKETLERLRQRAVIFLKIPSSSR